MQVSIIIVNYNTKKLTLQCLESIYKYLKKTKFEIILVDNNSSDGSVKAIKNKFPQVKIIPNKKNMGFGAANNQGVKQADYDWILLLNSDTELKDKSLDVWLSEIKAQESKFVYGVKLLNQDDSIQPSAGHFPTLGRVRAQMLFWDDLPFVKNNFKSYQQTNTSFYNKEQEVDWVTGAFMLMSKKLFTQVKGFDEQIFMYGEEIDLCYRLNKTGAQVIYTPKAEIYHYKSGSSPERFAKAIEGEYKGLLIFYQKHYPDQVGSLKKILSRGVVEKWDICYDKARESQNLSKIKSRYFL